MLDSSSARPVLLRPGPQAVLVAVAAVAVFAGTLANGFVYDDVPLLLENPWVRSVEGVREAFRQPLFGFLEDSSSSDPRAGYYRPLTHVTFFLLRAATGATPWSHHLFLVLAHALASVLVWRLLRACLPGGDAPARWAPLAGGLLFALHPVHVEPVAWMSGWMDVGATLSVLLAVALVVPGPASAGRWLLAALVWLGGLLLKETALVLPVLLWAAGRGAAGGTGWAWTGGRRALLLLLALVPYGALRVGALGLKLPADPAAGGALRGLDALALVAELGGKLVWPWPLSVVPPQGPVASPWEARVLVGAALVLGLAVLLGAALRRGREVLLAGLLWLLVPLVPVLFLQLRGVDAYAERYLYLPSVGFVLLVGLGVRGVLARWPARAPVVALATAGVLAGFAGLTAWYVPLWHDDVSLWRYTAQVAPEQPLARAYLGNAYLKAGRLEEAVPQLETAAAALPGAFRVHSDLAVSYARTGRLEEALRALERAVRLRPDSAMAQHNLGLGLRRAGRLDEAVARFREAVRLSPGRAESHLELGRTLLQQGRGAEAVAPLEEALRLRPGLEAARRALLSARAGAPSPMP